MGSSSHTVERRTVNRGDDGSIPPAAISKLRQFRSPTVSFGRDAKAEGPFCLVSTPGEVKDPTQGADV